VEVAGLAEDAECEVRGRARNDRGTSSWSQPLRMRTRRVAAEGGCDAGAYRWSQTKADVTLQITVRAFPCCP
jgi:hypothetical protein